MKRLSSLIIIILLLSLACDADTTPAPTPMWPPPIVLSVQPTDRREPTPGIQTVVLDDDLTNISGLWIAAGQEPSTANVTSTGSTLIAEMDVAAQSIAGITRNLSDLSAPPDGITLTLQADGRTFNMLVGAREEDGSWYHTYLRLDPDDGERTVEISFDWMRINQDSEDENQTLDHDQVIDLMIVDFSGFTGPLGFGTLEISKATFWQGSASTPLTQCIMDGPASTEFLTGVDANTILEGEDRGETWFVGDTAVDPLELFAAQGAQALRLRVWVGEDGSSKLNYATELASRAHEAGLRVYPALFLSEDWADVNKQPVPEIWQDLSLEERAAAIRTYSQETVSRLLETGIDVPYYAIGNETDFGIAGVFAELDQRSIENLENNIWPETAALLQAGIEGVRQVDPDALILLHIAQSYAPSFVRAYFRSMQDLGVEFDIAGLSLYPSAFGPTVIEGFCQSIELLGSELGLPVIIPEFAYPADPPTGSLFASWYNDLPGYPLTPEGQAQWLADFFEAMRAHPNVIGAYYFSPTYYWSGDLWGSFSLFDQEGRAYPAIGAFTPPE